jgi:lysophospholipase L1-like esterase/N-acetylneuraminic acid mutarotase
LQMKRPKLLTAAVSVLSLSLVLTTFPNSVGAAPGDVIYRINAGGPQLSGTPVWEADTPTNPSPYVSSDTKVAGTSNTINMSHPSMPSGTPSALFAKHRYDPVAAPEMKWSFPVSSGTYEVRLFFAETFAGAQTVGGRVFDVSIEGAPVLDDYDVYADVGSNRAVMKSFVVSSDSNLEIDFKHVVENPMVNGIEIRSSVAQASTLGASPSTVAFPSTQVGGTSVQAVTLTNLGGAGDPGILIDSTMISGANAGQFSDSFDDAGSINLGPGQSTTVNTTFAPTSTGHKSATLSVVHTGSNSPLSITLDGEGTQSTAVGFAKSSLQGETSNFPTSLQFGPDGRLYVAQFDGQVKIYDVVRNGPNNYGVVATQTINLVKNLPNRNDDGTLNTTVVNRLVTGLLVTGTANNPVIYVASSDPRIGAGLDGTDLNLDTNSGIISRLTWNGSSWAKLDIVRGLPRSEENHTANGMALNPTSNTLYVAQGGNTNRGATSNNFARLPEFALSAAILSVDLGAIGNSTYDLPTLDDENRAGTPDANDPFGGNNGKNQARLVPGGPVQVHAPGFRNPYDILIHSSGRMYSIDNNGNAGWGDVPVNEGPAGNCTNGINEPGTGGPDHLHLITGAGYYAGHPNPTRGNMANKFNASSPQSPVSVANSIECDYRGPAENGSLTTFAGSTNGLAEYTTNNFSGALKGELFAAGYSSNVLYRAKFNSAGTQVIEKGQLFSNVGSKPLDVVTQGSNGAFPGTIWVADTNGAIHVFEPNDFGGGGGGNCTGAYDQGLDEDGDGYTNADEIDNGTNPCSSADVPSDSDGDQISDLNDTDDDNDGIADTSDRFARDASNGATTNLPVSYIWDNDAPPAGGFLNLGWTGLMTNGTSDYRTLFDSDNIIAGGAAGVMTVESVPKGDAWQTTNTQKYGFQFGFNPPASGKFTARTRIMAPFAGMSPQNYQSMGFYLGTGDQDNYVKLVTAADNGTKIQFVKEVSASVSSNRKDPVTMPGPDYVDLYLTVDADALTVQPSYTVTANGVTGGRIDVGAPVAIPSSWLTSPMALGIISTSKGTGPEFAATWDFIDVKAGTGGEGGGSAPGTWETRAPSGPLRAELSYVNAGGKFYLAGGRKTAHEVYNPATDSWSNVAPLPVALDHVQAVEVSGKIYYIGGLTGWPGPHVNTVYIYDPVTNSFTQGAPMPRGRGAGGVAVHQGKIYYAGGLHDGVAVPWFDVYDPAANSWTQLPDMPTARDHFHGAVVNGKFYAIGGRKSEVGNNATTKVNEAYNFSTGQWQTGFAPLPTARGGFAAPVHDDEIFIIGGEGGGIAHSKVEAYNTSTNSWRTLAPMPTARHGIQAAVCNGGFYIAGGGKQQGGGGLTDVHEVFFPEGPTTCTGSSPPPPPPAQGTRVTPAPIMPLGDSITHGTEVPGGYRVKLEDHIIVAKRDFTFVGTQTSGDINLESRRHEGHKGYRIEDIANEVETWLGAQKPDHILLTIGTNDILQNNQLTTAPARLSALIDRITVSRPNARLVVSSLPPLSDPSLDVKVQQFNSTIPAIVESKVNQGKSVSFVDMYSALTAADLRDGIHPNAVGYARMAERWRDALVPLLPERPTPPQATCPCSLWPVTNVDGTMSSVTTAREVGLKFRTDLPGQITGIRFFKKGAANAGPHVAHLWSLDGSLLASATFANETDSGWQQVNFANPVAVTADTTYVASYYAPFGRFTAKPQYFTEQMDVNYPLRALAWGMSTANGVYKSGSSGFPATGSQANFWVDVIFRPS